MQAAAFTDCVYIPFADSICPLPGPVNITTVEKNAGSGIKNTVYHVHSVQHYHPKCIACIFFLFVCFVFGRGSDSNSHINEECWLYLYGNITSIQPFLCFYK